MISKQITLTQNIMKYLLNLTLMASALMFSACSSEDEAHTYGEDGDQTHEPVPSQTSEKEHSHGPDSDHSHDAALEGAGVITQWTDKTELFMEYPALIVGQEATFAVHLTRLSDFKAISESEVQFIFSSTRGMEGSLTETEVRIPGIYGPDVIFDRAGRYDLTIIIKGMVDDTLKVNGIPVYASADEVPPAHEEEDSNLISFLKEQQWKIPFGTAKVDKSTLTRTVEAHGEISARNSGQAVVTAPFSGIILPAMNANLPVAGSSVRKGSSVLVLNPAIQSADGENYAQQFINAQAELELARKDLDRKQRLFEREAIPEAELDRARIDYRRALIQFQTINEIVQVDTSSYDSYGDSEESYRFELKAPISGTFLETYVTPGMQVNVGDPLFVIADLSKVWLNVHLPASERMSVTTPGTASFRIQGEEKLYDLAELSGRLISMGKSVDPQTRTISMIYELNNPTQSLQTGLFANVYVDTEQKKDVHAISESSLIEEEGSFFVFVHVAGESFEKRQVTTGIRDRGMVEIVSGLNDGEHVVTINPYQVKLASLSSEAPSHGHAH
ncbi:MAG: efflux RND transporter periplasmic adaptor subunit [Balneolaceae bacterium]|nr:efflux RND transporter periplasmic adaptor subunit [Balneolaceae bacterium]